MHLDLSRVLHLFFDLLGQITGQDDHLILGNDLGLHQHTDLTAGLNGICLINAVEGGGDGLQLLQTLDVVLQILTARTGACGGDGIGCLHQTGNDSAGLHIVVVCLDGVDDVLALLVLPGEFHAQSHMGSFHLMVDGLTQIVEQTGTLGGLNVSAQFGGHHAGDVADFHGVLHYRTSYGQNVLQHSVEVSHIAGMMAAELGADVQAAKRAGLLHDLGKSIDHEMEGTHVALGVEFARKYKEREDIIHAIEAHHNDVEPRTVIACLVQAADAISAARPGARRENLENYIKRLEQLESISTSFNGVDKAYAIQAGREVRVMVKPEIISEDQMVILARNLAKKIEEEMEYPGQIKVHLLRETTAVEYAK